VVTPLDAPLLGSNVIHGPEAKIWCHNIWTGSKRLFFTVILVDSYFSWI
jgi:hypothetical protein